MKLLIANWKALITVPEAMEWLHTFLDYVNSNAIEEKLEANDVHIVICPPFPFLSVVKEKCLLYKNITVGSQTVSGMNQGTFTGEVTAEFLKEYVSYTIIGHSERRTYFHLSEEEIAQQVEQATTHGISPIVCIRNEQDIIHPNVTHIAYEPIEAIGSGQNASIQDVITMKQKLNLPEHTYFIYGGSVDAENIKTYLNSGEIDGFLVGTASLQADSFIKLVEAII
ncbi:MAG TPA: triose-phosphate isomerase [Candidatus Woesebacteria bacterium]|nr:triose-phosphate isomerase [Candidatus Woesebacteria bacterium]